MRIVKDSKYLVDLASSEGSTVSSHRSFDSLTSFILSQKNNLLPRARAEICGDVDEHTKSKCSSSEIQHGAKKGVSEFSLGTSESEADERYL
jgi:hypothetical protein